MDWKSITTNPLVVVLVAAGAFVAGKYSAPVKIVESVKTVEVQKDVQVVEKKLDLTELQVILTKFAQSAQKDVYRKRTIDVKPDGSKHITEESSDKSKTETQSSTDAKKETAARSEEATKIWKETVKVEERIKLVEKLSLPNWSFGLTAGVAFHIPSISLVSATTYIPGIPEYLSVGAFVEKRLFGKTYLQLWANNQANLGLNLRWGF